MLGQLCAYSGAWLSTLYMGYKQGWVINKGGLFPWRCWRVWAGEGRFAGTEEFLGWRNWCGLLWLQWDGGRHLSLGAQLTSSWDNVLSRGKVSQPHLDMQKMWWSCSNLGKLIS